MGHFVLVVGEQFVTCVASGNDDLVVFLAASKQFYEWFSPPACLSVYKIRDKKNVFSVGTIKNENISWEQLLSDIGENNDMYLGIIHCTIRNSYTDYVKSRGKHQSR